MNELTLLERFLGLTPTLVDIIKLEDFILSLPKGLQVSFPECTTHKFGSNGEYLRTLTISKGDVITGAVHRFPCQNIVSKGKIVVWSDGEKKVIDATEFPAIFESKAGIKRVGYALEDTIWTTSHIVTSTTVEDVEKELTMSNAEALELNREQLRSIA